MSDAPFRYIGRGGYSDSSLYLEGDDIQIRVVSGDPEYEEKTAHLIEAAPALYETAQAALTVLLSAPDFGGRAELVADFAAAVKTADAR